MSSAYKVVAVLFIEGNQTKKYNGRLFFFFFCLG